MGYILPITQYTYVNYHARMLESRKSPYYIDSTYKVMFNKIQNNRQSLYEKTENEIENNQDTNQLDKSETKSLQQVTLNVPRNSHVMNTTEETALTGKGKWINQKV